MKDNLKVNETIEQEIRKKKRRFPLIVFLITLLCLGGFGILIGSGVLPVPIGDGRVVDMETAKLLKQASDVKDELTLRKLLLLDMEIPITVTEDIKVDESLIVKGKKTLYGNAAISMNIFGVFQERSIFTVQKRAVLTVDGLVLDGNGMADGYMINQGGTLKYLSGTIKYIRYGIRTHGEVLVEDVEIKTVGKAAVQSLFKSKVVLNGGTYSNSSNYLIHVDSASNMVINEGVVIERARGHNIYNNGTLRIHGGTIKEANQCGINNEGDLVMEYKGSKPNGYIEITNTGSAAVRMNSNDNCEIRDLHTTNIGTNAVLVTDLRAKGDLVVEDCLLETTGQVSGNAMSLCGKVDVKNIQVKDTKEGAIYVKKGGNITVENITVENCGGVAMAVEGGSVKARNMSVNGTLTGVWVKKKDNSKGSLNLSDITISGSESGNLYAYEGTELNVKNAVLEKSVTANVNLRSAEVVLEDVKVLGTSEAKNCLYAAEGASVTLLGDTMISGGVARGVGLVNANLTMKSGSICNNIGTEPGAGVMVIDGGTFQMLGGSISGNKTTASGGGVYVEHKSIFNMKGGTIKENEAKGGAGAVVQGVMNLENGSICNNLSTDVGGGINVGRNQGKKTYGILNMTGGKICNNKAVNSGGGIHVSWTSYANLSGGEVTGNETQADGDGILDNGNTTVSGNFYMGDNAIAMCSKSIVLKIKGSSLSKHSVNKPFLITPYMSSTTGTTVVECDSESAASTLLDCVASGSAAFKLCQNGKNTKTLTVFYNEADMNMAGADTVYVTNFAQLKKAVESVRSKRHVVIGADINMESVITVPSGTTVCIRDDGEARTLRRMSGTTESFFRTYHGTGIYLAGTSEGKLILDGAHSGNADPAKLAALVQVRGTTEIRNVMFLNNGAAAAKIDGAFVQHIYGKLSVYDSTLNGAIGNRGAAIYIADAGAEVKIENTEFRNNIASEGGAILNYGKLAVKSCDFIKNKTTAKDGGAIFNNFNAELVIHDSKFTSNMSERNGGAVGNNTDGVIVIRESEFDSNTAGNFGGAIINHTGGTIEMEGSTAKAVTFGKNSARLGSDIYDNGSKLFKISNASFAGGKVTLNSNVEISDKVTGAIFEYRKSDVNVIIGEKGITGDSDVKIAAHTHGIQAVSAVGGPDMIQNAVSSGSIAGAGSINSNKEWWTIDVKGKGYYNANVGADYISWSNAMKHVGGGNFYLQENVTLKEKVTISNDIKIYGNKKTIDIGSLTGQIFTVRSGGSLVLDGYAKGELILDGNAASKAASNTRIIFNDGGRFTLGENAVIQNLNTKWQGGGVYNNGAGTVYLYGDIRNIISTNQGGAVFNAGKSILTMEGGTISGNRGSEGGAIFNRGMLTISGGSFYENVSEKGGGAIVNHEGEILVSGKITGADMVCNVDAAKVTISKAGIDSDSAITLIPKIYKAGQKVLYAQDSSKEAADALTEAAKVIRVAPKGAEQYRIDADGKLTLDGTIVRTYEELRAAVEKIT